MFRLISFEHAKPPEVIWHELTSFFTPNALIWWAITILVPPMLNAVRRIVFPACICLEQAFKNILFAVFLFGLWGD